MVFLMFLLIFFTYYIQRIMYNIYWECIYESCNLDFKQVEQKSREVSRWLVFLPFSCFLGFSVSYFLTGFNVLEYVNITNPQRLLEIFAVLSMSISVFILLSLKPDCLPGNKYFKMLISDTYLFSGIMIFYHCFFTFVLNMKYTNEFFSPLYVFTFASIGIGFVVFLYYFNNTINRLKHSKIIKNIIYLMFLISYLLLIFG